MQLGQHFGDDCEPALRESNAPSDTPARNGVDTEGTEASETQKEALCDSETSESEVPMTLGNEE